MVLVGRVMKRECLRVGWKESGAFLREGGMGGAEGYVAATSGVVTSSETFGTERRAALC